MKIIELSLQHYRNFKNKIVLKFNEEINFIVGKNNFGKSNILRLFNKIFNSRSLIILSQEDFYDLEKEIIVKLRLKLDKNEELANLFIR